MGEKNQVIGLPRAKVGVKFPIAPSKKEEAPPSETKKEGESK